MAANSDYDRLRELLIGNEREALARLRDRLENPALRAADLADVLAESLGICNRHDADRLKRALQRPVEDCIHDSVRRDKKFFADILFPVIGPAIRKSIAETLREFVASINETVDHTFSPKGIRWRLEAYRTGKSFGEIVLKHTLVYRVDQLYLIDNTGGLLMQHVSHRGAVSQDTDAVSAMLTAIQDFMRDSFATGEHNTLHTVEMGEFTLCLTHGPRATLAGLVRGVAPPDLRERFNQVIDTLHADYDKLLADFDGDKQPMEALKPLLEEALLEARQATPAAKSPGWRKRFLKSPALWLAVLLLAVIVFFSYRDYRARMLQSELATAFDGQPGIVLLGIERGAGGFRVVGLADPDARDPRAVVAAPRFQGIPIELSFAPYASSLPELVLLRARRALRIPDGVAASFDAGTLTLRGQASMAWIERARNAVLFVPGLESVDLDELSVDPADLEAQRLREAELALAAERRAAERRRLDEERERLAQEQVAARREFEAERKRLAEQEQAIRESEMQMLTNNIEEQTFGFGQAAVLDDSPETLNRTSAWIGRLMDVCELSDQECTVEVYGFTDGVGDEQLNRSLRSQRAERLRDLLVKAGSSADWFELKDPGPVLDSQRNTDLRIVTLQVKRAAHTDGNKN